jgi:hypothetical protein
MDRLKHPTRKRSRSIAVDVKQRLRAFLLGFAITDEDTVRMLAHRLHRLAPEGDYEAAARAWFAGLPGWPDAAPEAALALGRVAWLRADGNGRWPLALFADTPPAALVAALRAAVPALPPLALDRAMPPAGIERMRLRHLVVRAPRLRPRTA